MDVPKAETNKEKYQEFIIKGGKKENLPQPITNVEKYWAYIADKRRES